MSGKKKFSSLRPKRSVCPHPLPPSSAHAKSSQSPTQMVNRCFISHNKIFAIQKTFIAEDGKGNEIFRIRKRFARTSPPLSLSHGVKGRTDCWQLGRRRKRRSEMRARGMMSRWSSEVTFGEGARISLSLEVDDQEEEGVGVDGWWRRSRGNCGMRGRSLGINRL